ncbi:MAG: hypothetical protein V1734_06965 [Nanoarchaeota archaeon]
MSKLIGSPRNKSDLDEMIENSREANEIFLKEIEEERLEAERKTVEDEAERRAREKAVKAEAPLKDEKPLLHTPSKPLIQEPANADIVKFCGTKDLLKNDYDVLKDIYKGTYFSAEGEYTSGRIYITDKRVTGIRATSRHVLELPESICRLDKLKDLYFGENDIKALPKSLETMDWLEFAGFPQNPLNTKSKQMLDRMAKKGIQTSYSEWM